MSVERLDRTLNDYIDGRLPDDERARFEARMLREPDLAARVAELRAIGDALRASNDELSPGFYTRARARFEAGTAPRRRLRLMSWESLGLAAAAAIALVVFAPPLLRRDASVLTAPEVASRQMLDQVEDGKDKLAKVAAADSPTDVAKAEAWARADDDATGPFAAVAAGAGRDSAAANEPASGEPPARVHEERKADAEGTAAPRQVSVADVAEQSTSAVAPAAPPPEPQALPAPTTSLARPAPASAAPVETDRFAASKMAPSDSPAVFDSFPLTEALVAAGEIRSVDPSEVPGGWSFDTRPEERKKNVDDERLRLDRAQARGLQSTADARVAEKEDAAQPRWVLIGPRERPFSCAGLRISRKGDFWEVELAAPDAARPAAGFGCAVVLPGDGLAVRVVGP